MVLSLSLIHILVSGPAEDSVLDAIDNATGDTAIDLMKLSAEEMQSLFIDLQAHVTDVYKRQAFNRALNTNYLFLSAAPAGTPLKWLYVRGGGYYVCCLLYTSRCV